MFKSPNKDIYYNYLATTTNLKIAKKKYVPSAKALLSISDYLILCVQNCINKKSSYTNIIYRQGPLKYIGYIFISEISCHEIFI